MERKVIEMPETIKVNRLYADMVETKNGKKMRYKVITEGPDYTFWGANPMLDMVKPNYILNVEVGKKKDMFQGKPQLTILKVLDIERPPEPSNASPKDITHNQEEGQGSPSLTRPTPRTTLPLPPLPESLQESQILGMMTEALSKVAKLYGIGKDEIGVFAPIVATVLAGYLQKQSQEFSIKLTARIEAQKQANILSVKRG